MATYEFIIRNETESGGGGSPMAPTSAPTNNPKSSGGGSSFKSVAKKMVAAYGIAKSFADTTITHRINTVSLRTGNEELQQRYQFAYDIGKRALGIVESIAMGAMFGGAAGALIGAATSVAMTGVQIAQRAEEINLSRTAENISIDMANIRAGSMNDRQGRNY